MNIVVVACAGGGTSSLLCTKIKKESEKLGKRCEYEGILEFKSLEKFDEYRKDGVELLLVYGGVQLFLMDEIMKEFGSLFEIGLVAPQMRHLLPKVEEECIKYNIKFEQIPMSDFGMMRGDKLFTRIEELVKEG